MTPRVFNVYLAVSVIVVLNSINILVVADKRSNAFKIYSGFSVKTVSMTTETRSAMECSAICNYKKNDNNYCQLVTFKRDTQECLLSNGTASDMIYLGDDNYRTIVTGPGLSYKGTEFFTGFIRSVDPTNLTLFFVGDEPTNVTVFIPLLSTTDSFLLNGTAVKFYDYNLVHLNDGDSGLKGVHVSASNLISLFQYTGFEHSLDMSIVLPTTGIGRNYIIQASPNEKNTNNTYLVISTKDGAEISMTKGSTTTTITLNRLESYFRYTSGLVGTVIEASEDIAVLAGSPCSEIPSGMRHCDLLFETLPPEESYGDTFVVDYMYPRPDFTVGILAKKDQTIVTITDINGVTLETLVLNRAETAFREYMGSQTITMSSTEGILVTQYGHGGGFGNINPFGDPSMMVIAPLNKFGTDYDIFLPEMDMNVIKVVVDYEDRIRINDNPVVFVHNIAVTAPSAGTLRVAHVYVTTGRYRIRHIKHVPFAVYAYGGNMYSEYAMCAGWIK